MGIPRYISITLDLGELVNEYKSLLFRKEEIEERLMLHLRDLCYPCSNCNLCWEKEAPVNRICVMSHHVTCFSMNKSIEKRSGRPLYTD